MGKGGAGGKGGPEQCKFNSIPHKFLCGIGHTKKVPREDREPEPERNPSWDLPRTPPADG